MATFNLIKLVCTVEGAERACKYTTDMIHFPSFSAYERAFALFEDDEANSKHAHFMYLMVQKGFDLLNEHAMVKKKYNMDHVEFVVEAAMRYGIAASKPPGMETCDWICDKFAVFSKKDDVGSGIIVPVVQKLRIAQIMMTTRMVCDPLLSQQCHEHLKQRSRNMFSRWTEQVNVLARSRKTSNNDDEDEEESDE